MTPDRWRWSPPLREASRGFVPTSQDPPIQQLVLERDPSGWALVVATQMMAASNRFAVDRVWPVFFQTWPHPHVVMDDFVLGGDDGLLDAMAEVLHPTGCQRQKAWRITRMSLEWVGRGYVSRRPDSWARVQDLYGCGPYTGESWRLFVQGDLSARYEDSVVEAWAQLARDGKLSADLMPGRTAS